MKKPLKYSVLAISIGLATACSGGGGGGNSDSANPAYDQKEVKANTQVPSISYVRDDLKDEVRKIKELTLFDPVTKKTVKVIQLSDLPKGTIKDTVSSTENALTTYIRMINLPYSTTVTSHTNDTKEIAELAYFAGYPTRWENLPKGSATYQGTSLGLNTSGMLTLTANFDDKSVQGRIYNRRHDNGAVLSDITLQKSSITRHNYNDDVRTINGTTFAGTAINNGVRDYYRGVFNGPNAEEVTGFVSDYYDSDGYESFAGEKQ